MDTNVNQFKRLIQIPLPGATHTDDLYYIFRDLDVPIANAFYQNLTKESIEYSYIKRVSTLWANFAKNG